MKDFFEMLALSGGGSVEIVAWSIFIGTVLASFVALYEKRYIGAFVRALLGAGANDEESAKSLGELGFRNAFFIKMAMKGKSALSTVVFLSGEEITRDEDGKVVPVIRRDFDAKTARFFIPAERADHAAIRFDQRGTHIMSLVVGMLAFAFLAALAVKYLPMAIDYFRTLGDSL